MTECNKASPPRPRRWPQYHHPPATQRIHAPAPKAPTNLQSPPSLAPKRVMSCSQILFPCGGGPQLPRCSTLRLRLKSITMGPSSMSVGLSFPAPTATSHAGSGTSKRVQIKFLASSTSNATSSVTSYPLLLLPQPPTLQAVLPHIHFYCFPCCFPLTTSHLVASPLGLATMTAAATTRATSAVLVEDNAEGVQ